MSLESVTDDTFEKEVLQAELPVIIDFYATWCDPCKALAPIYEDVSKLYTDKVKFMTCDIEDSKIAMNYKVMRIPTLIIFDKGEEIARRRGYLDKDTLVAFIDKTMEVKK